MFKKHLSDAKENRIEFIDSLRGLCILLMVIYHGAYDLYLFAGLPEYILFNPLINSLQVFFAGVFVVVSGISTQFSKNNLKRGLIMLFCGILVTIVTYIIDSSFFVVFGILHFLGTAAIIYHLVPKIPKISPYVCLLLFFVFKFILSFTFNVPHLWFLGISDKSFTSTDYFPIFPWIFAYYLGVHFGRLFKKNQIPKEIHSFKCRFLSFIGRNTMIIYLAHQPILYLMVKFLPA